MDEIDDLDAGYETTDESSGSATSWREALEQSIPDDFGDDDDEVSDKDETTDIEQKIEDEPKADEEKEVATIEALPEDVRESITLNTSIADSFKETIQPHWDHIQSIGANPYEHINQLLEISQVLYSGTPESKAQLVATLYKNFGVDFDLLDNAIAEIDTKPTVEQTIIQKLDRLERQMAAPQKQAAPAPAPQAEQPSREMIAEVEAFAASHPHFEKLQADIGLLLQSGRANSLEEAYNKALRLNDGIQAEAKAKTKTAAVAGKTQVKSSGSPSSETQTKPKLSLRDAIARAYDAQR